MSRYNTGLRNTGLHNNSLSSRNSKNNTSYTPKLFIFAIIFIVICIFSAIIANLSASSIKEENEQINAELQELENQINDQASQIEKTLSESKQ